MLSDIYLTSCRDIIFKDSQFGLTMVPASACLYPFKVPLHKSGPAYFTLEYTASHAYGATIQVELESQPNTKAELQGERLESPWNRASSGYPGKKKKKRVFHFHLCLFLFLSGPTSLPSHLCYLNGKHKRCPSNVPPPPLQIYCSFPASPSPSLPPDHPDYHSEWRECEWVCSCARIVHLV